ncbi:hypothetical protein ACIA8G_01305 [Lentzea sp. NPDC051213]
MAGKYADRSGAEAAALALVRPGPHQALVAALEPRAATGWL